MTISNQPLDITPSFPAIKPALNLNFTGGTVDNRITFSRASIGTYYDKTGVLQTANNDIPRIDYDPATLECKGLLIEESRTNLLIYSSQFVGWGKINSTVTANATTAPDGTPTASLISNIGNTVSLAQSPTITVSASSTTDYYATIYAKKGTSSSFTFNCYYIGNVEDNVLFNFDTGVVSSVPYTGEYIFQNVGNGWYKCGFRMSRDSTGTKTQILFRIWESGRGASSGDTYIWGSQLEQGQFATSYIPTTIASVTRSADSASMTGNNFSSWYNQTQGTISVEFSINTPLASVNNRAIYALNRYGSGGQNRLDYRNTGQVNSINNVSLNTGTAYVQTVSNKVASAYSVTDSAICLNRATVSTYSLSAMPLVNQLLIGAIDGGGSQLNGYIRNIQYYPARLPNNVLQTMTK